MGTVVVQAGMASPGGGVAVAAEVTLSGHTREEKSLYVAARAALGSGWGSGTQRECQALKGVARGCGAREW